MERQDGFGGSELCELTCSVSSDGMQVKVRLVEDVNIAVGQPVSLKSKAHRVDALYRKAW